MGIARNIISGVRDWIRQEDTPETHTLLSPSDIKSVPMFMEGGGQGNSGSVRVWSSAQAWDRAIDSALNGWNNSEINYAAEVGDLRLSVLLMAAVRWAGVLLSTGRMQVVELDGDEKEDPILDHPFVKLFKRPNPDTTSRNLWKQFGCSWVFGGEFYSLLGRDNAGRVKEIYYEPNLTIEPRWDKNLFPEDETANDFIQYFEIKRSGRWIPVRKKDVFRVYDLLDPITRRGTNGIDGLMRTIFTDNEREKYMAMLLKNFGVSPKGVAPKFESAVLDQEQVQQSLKRKWSGPEQGQAGVFNVPMEVLDFGTDFSANAMEKIAFISESRVAAAIGISAQSLRFMVSMQSSSYNNIREFRREDYEGWIMPTHEDFLTAAENQILRDMDENERHELRFDYSKVPIVQRDKMETAKETDLLVRNRTIDQAEARERHSYEFDESHKGVYYPVPATTITLSPIGDGQNEPPEPVKAANLPDDKLEESADFWGKHEALTDEQKSYMDAPEYKPNGHLPS